MPSLTEAVRALEHRSSIALEPATQMGFDEWLNEAIWRIFAL